jgi:Helix-turn-helix domain
MKRAYGPGRHMDLENRGIVQLIEQGMIQREIATHLGIHHSTVNRWCVRHGISTGRTGPIAGARHPEWRGGRTLDKHGYVLVWVPMHPQCRRIGRLAEHRLLAEVLLCRYLRPEEVIDHIDGCPYHNWPENLRIFASNADHLCWTTSLQPKPSQRGSIPGAYNSPQKLPRCPDEAATLAQCPSKIAETLSWYIASHRPTIAHRSLSLRELRSAGAWRNPFPRPSRG